MHGMRLLSFCMQSLMMARKSIVWFKQTDLRTIDHRPLTLAHEECSSVDHIFIFDPHHFRSTILGEPSISLRRLKYQYECLLDVDRQLREHGCKMNVFLGDSCTILSHLTKDVYDWNLYYHVERMVDEDVLLRKVANTLASHVKVHSIYDTGGLVPLHRLPFSLDKLDTYSAFRKAVEGGSLLENSDSLPLPRPCAWKPRFISINNRSSPLPDNCIAVDLSEDHIDHQVICIWNTIVTSLNMPTWLYSEVSDGYEELQEDPRSAIVGLSGGERKAWQQLQDYTQLGPGKLQDYKALRNDMVGINYSTKLSAYLAHGCITARAVYHHLQQFQQSMIAAPSSLCETEIAKVKESIQLLVWHLLWRDFMHLYALQRGRSLFFRYGLLSSRRHENNQEPETPSFSQSFTTASAIDNGQKNINNEEQEDSYRYREVINTQSGEWHRFRSWCQGKTGYPFIDASMRELLRTGYMSNRGRQNVASFLINDLQVNWTWGAMHFEQYLLDYDVAANYGNWQYLAGVGSDPRTIQPTLTSMSATTDSRNNASNDGKRTIPRPIGRYFNIVKQAYMYDPQALFMSMWCPELSVLRQRNSESSETLIEENFDYYFDRSLLTARLQDYYLVTNTTVECTTAATADAIVEKISSIYPMEAIVPLLHSSSGNEKNSNSGEGGKELAAVKDTIARSKRLKQTKKIKHGDIPLMSQNSGITASKSDG